APFVETEWGGEIYSIMCALKEVIDPNNLLNPGVIINKDKSAHIQHLKDLPQVEEEVDKCMECGFCEHRCPSRDITMTPRQRIVVRRELIKLKSTGKQAVHNELLNQYKYDGMDTCAVDGLCAEACPVDINTGMLIKRLRKENHNAFSNRIAVLIAKNFAVVAWSVKNGIRIGNGVNKLLGRNTMRRITGGLKSVIPSMPLWSNQLKATNTVQRPAIVQTESRSVVYYPTCISRAMGGNIGSTTTVLDSFMRVAAKSGVTCILPNNIAGSCCGQPFSSKGFNEAYAIMANKTISLLWEWTKEGTIPIVVDITACTHTLQTCAPVLTAENSKRFKAMKIIDSIEFISDFL
ncbi:MAG: 4Fe-4S dicluster domain-containing protein, partial [Pedobacter sp.]